MSWRSEAVTDLPSWVIQYAARRYGTTNIPPSVELAWLYLLDGAYQFHWSWNIKGMVERAPEFVMKYYSALHATNISNAWLLLVTSAADGYIDQSVGPLQYDIVDFGRQVLVNLFVDIHAMYTATYNMYSRHKVNTSTQLDAIRSAMLQLFDDLDMLLASNTNFLLGHWIADARASIPNMYPPDAVDNAEFNARNQITMWGPDENIEDYASKEWAGLVKDYYKERWALFTGLVNEAVREGKTFDHDAYESARYLLEKKFSFTIKAYPTSPVGNPVDIAIMLIKSYLFLDFRGICWRKNLAFTIKAYPTCPVGNPVDIAIISYLFLDFTNYTVYDNTNVSGNNILIPHAWNTLVGQLAYLCNVNPGCVGFNSNGYLKRSVSTRTYSEGTALYVKRGTLNKYTTKKKKHFIYG